MSRNLILNQGIYLKYILFFLTILINKPVSGQEASGFSEEQLMLLIEELSAQHEENMDFTILQEEFTQLAENPVRINIASFEELGRIRLLTDFQIQSIINYIKKNGPVLSIYELQFVHGFDEELPELHRGVYMGLGRPRAHQKK